MVQSGPGARTGSGLWTMLPGRRNVYVLLDVLCVSVASLPFIIMTLINSPYKRGFYCSDDSIRYPYRDDTITHGLMAGVTISCTIIIITSGEMYMVFSKRLYSRSECNNYVAALYKVVGTYLFGAAVSQSLTDLAKYMIGRPRPNFLAVCDPDWTAVNCSGYVTQFTCRGSHANVTESRLSFYSGHSSFGMYCMLFLSLYIQARLCGKWARLLRPTIQFFLISFALYVGYTRVSDYKHHWSDVLVGLIQGAIVASLTVRYVSDFFKVRPPLQCSGDPLESKPSLQLCESDQNHFGYLAGS
ncbi:phospholipid phosphatase 2 [Bombina bombina]|uniref:phospholipid phosphatase 2 n=1 Tax=Bombina bombina TaxID=8345 RepID=UPI00235A9ECB|nr:phospholipid phosphatase 2 [Bombina bombina]